MVAIGLPSLSRIRIELHVAHATCNRSVRNRCHHLSAIPAHRTNINPFRSERPFGLQSRKCLDRRTYKHRPAYFFSSDPPEESFEQKPSMLEHCTLLLYDFELDAGIAHCIALYQNRRFLIFPPLSGFEPTTPLQLSKNLAAVCPIQTVSFPPQSDPSFVRKDQSNDITIHVPPTRVKGVTTSLTLTD